MEDILTSSDYNKVDVVQLVRMSDCGSEGRGFESHLPPKTLSKMEKQLLNLGLTKEEAMEFIALVRKLNIDLPRLRKTISEIYSVDSLTKFELLCLIKDKIG